MAIRFAAVIILAASLQGCGLFSKFCKPEERVVIKTVEIFTEVPTMPAAPATLTSEREKHNIKFTKIDDPEAVAGLTAPEIENLKVLLSELVGLNRAWKAWYEVNRADP